MSDMHNTSRQYFSGGRNPGHTEEDASGAAQLVASSLVCLPAVDAGGAGPKAESWAFATDAEGLRILSVRPSSERGLPDASL